MSPRREDYTPHVVLPKVGPDRPPSNRSFLSLDNDRNTKSTSSEYRLRFANHHPKRPYCFHAQPSHVFDFVPMPINSKSSSQSSSTASFVKDTEYQERYPNYPSFIPMQELLPPHMSSNPNMQSDTQRKKESMTRSQYFHELALDNAKSNGTPRAMGVSEQRTAFQWPSRYPQPYQKQQQQETPTPVYPPYYTPRNIYEPLPPIQRTTINAYN
jgi:hypothetical protein